VDGSSHLPPSLCTLNITRPSEADASYHINPLFPLGPLVTTRPTVAREVLNMRRSATSLQACTPHVSVQPLPYAVAPSPLPAPQKHPTHRGQGGVEHEQVGHCLRPLAAPQLAPAHLEGVQAALVLDGVADGRST
jgi:hypothetical protein